MTSKSVQFGKMLFKKSEYIYDFEGGDPLTMINLKMNFQINLTDFLKIEKYT